MAEANFELVKRVLKPQYLTNGYGPTETVVTPLLWKVSVDERCDAVYAPIGTRIGERTLYVLDEHLNPCPMVWRASCTSAAKALPVGITSGPA